MPLMMERERGMGKRGKERVRKGESEKERKRKGEREREQSRTEQ